MEGKGTPLLGPNCGDSSSQRRVKGREMNEGDVLAKQVHMFGSWDPFRNILSRFKYSEASALRLLIHEFRKEELNRSGEVVLDFGFGNGNALFWFRPASRIFGLEISEAAIKAARRKAERKKYCCYNFISPPTSDSVSIPFADGFFSVIICSHAIEHVYSDEKLIAELYRVCCPGGKFFIAVPIDIPDESRFLNQVDRLNPDFPLKSFHVFRYNLKSITGVVRMMGFKVLRSYAADAVMDFVENSFWGCLPTRILFSFLPLQGWFIFDRCLKERGFRFRQGILVAKK